jgi:hypothetical protein
MNTDEGQFSISRQRINPKIYCYLGLLMLGAVGGCEKESEPPGRMASMVPPPPLTASETSEAPRSISSATASNAGAFDSTDCYRANFPFALAISKSLIPSEVKFYCSANWDIQAFESVRAALKQANFDPVEALVRTASPSKKLLLRKTAGASIEAAEKGPLGMGAVYCVFQWLPHLDALHRNSSDAEVVRKNFAVQDFQALTNAAALIDWNRVAEINGAEASNAAQTNSVLRLSDVAKVILAMYDKK